MENIVKYLFEAGALKRIKRSGWWLAGVKDPESVAEHSFRAAIIAFILAKLDGKSDEIANKLAAAAVFHDMHETRMLDLNKVAARYLNKQDQISRTVEKDQLNLLPEGVHNAMQSILNLNEKEKEILKDADLLEMAFQAKEYIEIGYSDCEEWIESAEKKLKTKNARDLLKKMKRMDSKEWYIHLKKLD